MKKIIKLILLLLLVAASGYVLLSPYIKEKKRDALQPDIADKIIRFHIIANSDEEIDQDIKLEVRDAVGSYLSKKLKAANGKEESESIIKEQIPEIIEVATQELHNRGFSYDVTANLCKTYFPQKEYDKFVFPEGEYEALEIRIGEGLGHNWWCVLFPEMCFANTMYQVDENSEEKLREILTEQEYEAVLNSGKYEVRLKFLEYFK